MKNLIITILALVTIALADKPICTKVYDTDKYVEFYCEGGNVASAKMRVAKDLAYIVYEGDDTTGTHFIKKDARRERTERGITWSQHTYIDKYGVKSVDEYIHWHSTESLYSLYKAVYCVFE